MVAVNPPVAGNPGNPGIPTNPQYRPCDYAVVQQVQIQSVAGAQLTFRSRSNKNTLASFTVPTSQVMTSGPTGAPDAVKWAPGQIGNLYLSKEGWQATAAVDGGLYGLGTQAILYKWPQCAPFRGIEALRVMPSKIEVVAAGATYTVKPGQVIQWTGAAPISFASTAGPQKDVWPMKIVVTGASQAESEYPGSADVLDCDLADFVQTIDWKPGTAVSLRLTENGFQAFNVVQEAIHQYAAGAAAPYPGPLVDDWHGKDGKLAPAHKAALDKARARVADVPPEIRQHGKRPASR